MPRTWLICGAAAVAAGAIVWNQYRSVSHRTAPPLQTIQLAAVDAPDEPSGQEESDAVDVIDLTRLPLETPEPPAARFEVPDDLPPVADGSAGPSAQTVEPNVADFKPLSVDEPARMLPGGLVAFLTRVAGYAWSRSVGDERRGWEQLPIVPRPAQAAYRHPQQSCPYLGGSPYDGAQYRSSVVAPAATGEEGQTAPPIAPKLAPKVDEKHKQPKVDTMEIRPGDVVPGSSRRPF